jgi:phosphonate transport system ATP-binding protein
VALEDASLSIAPGELVALVGPSGGGKSTLIRLLGGVLRPTSGTILADGRSLASFSGAELRRFRARCGVVGQGLSLVPQLSVHQNVIAGFLPFWPWYRVMLSTLWPQERRRVSEVLEEVGIADRQWDPTSVLSGGQQQRVAIARALIGRPKTILADEPTSSLDPRTAEQTTELILREARRHQATLVFCTHWFELVRSHVHRVVGLRNGRVVLDLAAKDVTDAALDQLYAGSHERI